MKAQDFHNDDHDRIVIEPEKQKDADKLSAIFMTLSDIMGDAMLLTQARGIFDDDLDVDVDRSEFGKFRGINLCPTCCRKAVMLYKDAAQCLTDLIDEVEKQACEIENR